MNWKNLVIVVPATECRTEGEKPSEIIKAFRVYFPSLPSILPDYLEPYHAGIVVEEWNDGRFYFLEHNEEFLFHSLAAAELKVEEFARGWGYIP
jgi:hypothetical protein